MPSTDKKAIEERSATYKGDAASPRWEELRTEVQKKKSALQVEGRSAEERAGEFARLNYLLEPRNTPPASPLPDMPDLPNAFDLELEALALELELELLNF